jgi:hypothetical protein
MQQDVETPGLVPDTPEQLTSAELVKLIRKLRWIGLEDEARQLQAVLNRFPADERAVVPGAPLECD